MTDAGLRAAVNSSVCEGHALCLSIAPAVFEMGSDERAYVTDTDITPDLVLAVRQAADSCPTQAISLQDGPQSP